MFVWIVFERDEMEEWVIDVFDNIEAAERLAEENWNYRRVARYEVSN